MVIIGAGTIDFVGVVVVLFCSIFVVAFIMRTAKQTIPAGKLLSNLLYVPLD